MYDEMDVPRGLSDCTAMVGMCGDNDPFRACDRRY